jgi:hypothetical protein
MKTYPPEHFFDTPEIEYDIRTSELDGNIVMNGYPLPTIAVNCLYNNQEMAPAINDPNNGQMTPTNAFRHPFSPSSTFSFPK